jgi:hypothetical protein
MMGLVRKKMGEPGAEQDRRRGVRRLLLAFALSVLLHVGVALLMRPTYRPVADFALDFEVIEVKSGAPPKPTEPPPPETPEPEAKTPEPEVAKPPEKAAAKEAPKEVAPPKVVAVEDKPEDQGVEEGRDAGTGSGICLHNLFEFSSPDPAWLLYVSMGAFRETVYQKELGGTFASFEIGRRLEEMTGMAPADDVEALFVSAKDIFDWRTFQLAATYDGGEEKLAGEMKKRQGDTPLEWRSTDQGLEASRPGEFRFHLVGSGRVLAITHEPKSAAPEPAATPKAIVDKRGEASRRDGGPPDEPNQNKMDAGVPKAPELQRATFPSWPRQVTCLTELQKGDKKKQKREEPTGLIESARAHLAPDEEGHWPVALLATTDPRAVGLGSRLGQRLGFQLAVVRGYFTDPVRIEGVLTFKSDPARIEALANEWRQEAKRLSRDPFLALAGVSHLLENIEVRSEGTEISLILKMKEREVLSTLLFLQLQGKALERQLRSD